MSQTREGEAALQAARKRLEELQNGTRPQEIERTRALYEQARQQWLLLKTGPRIEDIRAAEANVDSVSAEYHLAKITENRQRELFAQNNTSAENYDRAQKERMVTQYRLRAARAELEKLNAGFRLEEIQAAKAQMDAASAAWSLAREGPRREQIEQAQAEVERAVFSLERAKVNLTETVITAPADCVVEVCRLQPGDLLAPNQTALTLLLPQPLWTRIYVPESRFRRPLAW